MRIFCTTLVADRCRPNAEAAPRQNVATRRDLATFMVIAIMTFGVNDSKRLSVADLEQIFGEDPEGQTTDRRRHRILTSSNHPQSISLKSSGREHVNTAERFAIYFGKSSQSSRVETSRVAESPFWSNQSLRIYVGLGTVVAYVLASIPTSVLRWGIRRRKKQ